MSIEKCLDKERMKEISRMQERGNNIYNNIRGGYKGNKTNFENN